MEQDKNMICKFLRNDEVGKLEPWDLPPEFLAEKKSSSLRTTPSGYWKEKEDEFIGIRAAESSSRSPSYQGARKTLEFYSLKDSTRGDGEGTKTGWIIHEYYHLRDESSVLFLEEDFVLCKVFKKDAADHDSRGMSGPGGDYTSNKLSKQDTSAQLGTRTLQAAWDAHAKSEDDVWEHYTKIHTDNPAVVYAVCHHCDKVLKAHPKKHGTSQLKRHMSSAKCRSSCSNPSTDDDREMLHRLRAVLDLYTQQKMDAKLECQEVGVHLTKLDPWDLLTPVYVTSSLNRETYGGSWEEIKKELTGIRMDQSQMQGGWKDICIEMEQIQMHEPNPQYVGLRRTLQFRHQDGRETDWIMLEYQQLDVIQSGPTLFLQGGMVIRKVLRYDKDAIAIAFSELEKQLNSHDDNGQGVNADKHGGGDSKRKRNADDDNGEYLNSEGIDTDITRTGDCMDIAVDRKGKRIDATSRHKSDVWMHFTKIYNKVHGVVRAVCHSCDRGYSSCRSTNGTSHLRRHNKSCTSKHFRTGLNAEVDREMLINGVNILLILAAKILMSKNKTVCRTEWLAPQDEDDQNL